MTDSARRRAPLVVAGPHPRLPRQHLRLPGRGDRAAGQRYGPGGAVPPPDRRAARGRLQLRRRPWRTMAASPSTCSRPTRSGPGTSRGSRRTGAGPAGRTRGPRFFEASTSTRRGSRAWARSTPGPGGRRDALDQRPRDGGGDRPDLRALACGGSIDGVRVLGEETIEAAIAEHSCGTDFVLDRPSRFGLGFQLTQPERPLGHRATGFRALWRRGVAGVRRPRPATQLRLYDEPGRAELAEPSQPGTDRRRLRGALSPQ